MRRRPLESQLDSVAKRAGEHGPNGRPSRPRKLGTEAMTVNMPIAMYLARIRHDARARFSWVTAPASAIRPRSAVKSEMGEVDLSILGRIANGVDDPFRGEIRTAAGRIVEVRAGEPVAGSATRRIDLGDAYLLPGAIDCHVHSGSTTSEGIYALTAAAAAGGVTTVIDMPYDVAAPVVSPQVMMAKRDRVRDEALVDVALLGTVRPGSGGVDVGPLVEAGAVGFKLSLFGTDAHRFPRIPDDQFLEVLSAIRRARQCRMRARRERGDHQATPGACPRLGRDVPARPLPLASAGERDPGRADGARVRKGDAAPSAPVPPEPRPVGRSRPVAMPQKACR